MSDNVVLDLSTDTATETAEKRAERLEKRVEQMTSEIRRLREAAEMAAGTKSYTPAELGALDMDAYRRARKSGSFTDPEEAA